MNTDVSFDFSGKNFVVIGGSSGIGRQIAEELLASNAHVLALARREDRLRELYGACPAAQIAAFDVTQGTTQDLLHIAEAFTAAHGKIHGMVYTAGISGATPLRGYDENFARQIMETSFWGAVKALQVFSRKKFAHPGSSFVAFSSVAEHVGEKGLFVYAAAKGALSAAVKSLTHDLSRDRHRLNIISPGYVITEMSENYSRVMGTLETVIARHLFGVGTPQDVSGMVLFLLSERAAWITGEDFVVDGGYLRGAWK